MRPLEMGTQSSRHRRVFTDSDGAVLLEALRHCRDACVEAHRRAPFHSDIYRRTTALQAAIDDVAEQLTGNRQHFWLNPDSFHAAPREKPRDD